MSANKTKPILVSKDVTLTKVALKIDGDIIKPTDKYTYLGSTVSSKGKYDDDILKLLEIARGALLFCAENYNCTAHNYDNKNKYIIKAYHSLVNLFIPI